MRRLVLSLGIVAYLLAQEKSGSKPGLPLKPERKLEFDTDEGTWLSLDVSQDGRPSCSICWAICTRFRSTAARPSRSLTGLPFDGQPVYSPDGSMIAFTSDRSGSDNLWIAKADGSEPSQLSKDKAGRFHLAQLDSGRRIRYRLAAVRRVWARTRSGCITSRAARACK